MNIQLLETPNFKADGGALFSVVPKTMWQRKYPTIEGNLCPVSNRSLLVQDADKVLVVDCGIGTKYDKKTMQFHGVFGEDTLEKSLAKHGLSPEDVTDVLFTHLHFDHCGGATKFDENGDLVPTFPKAKYWVTPEQWANYLNPNVREADSYFSENVMPIFERGMLHFVTSQTQFFPEMTLEIFNGHTCGFVVPYVKYKGKTLVYTGDMLPNSGNIPLKWLASYDINPLASLREKEAFLQKAAAENYILLFQHDFYTECATLQSVNGRVKLGEKMTLAEVLE